MKEEVLLINLPFAFSRYNVFHEVKNYDEHLGLEALASVLRVNGISVKLIDAHRDKIKIHEILHEIISGEYKIVGFSLFSFSLDILSELCSKVKEIRKNIHLTCGGHFVTGAYSEVLKRVSCLDSVIRGEGELTLLELVQNIIDHKDWKNIDGIAFRENDQIVLNSSRKLISELDEIPWPDRVFLDRKIDSGERINTIHMYSSRGCYGTCNFCSIKVFYESKGALWRARSAKNVVDELEVLNNKYKPALFMFVDDNFIGIGKKGKQRAFDIANEIIRRGLKLKFMISCRVDDVEPELFNILIRAGLTEVFLGVESFSNNELRFFNKHVVYEQNCKAIEYLQSKKVKLAIGFIMFTPYTSLEDVEKNIKFLDKYRLLDSAVKFNFLGRVVGSAFDKYEVPGLFKDDYNVIKYSKIQKPAYNYFNEKCGRLALIMEKEHWVMRSFIIDERFSKITNRVSNQDENKLERFLNFKLSEKIKRTSFRADINFIKDIITILQSELNEKIDLKLKSASTLWREGNRFASKVLRRIEKNQLNSKMSKWNFRLDSNVDMQKFDNKYRYMNLKTNSFIDLDHHGNNLLQILCSEKTMNCISLMNRLHLDQEGTIKFIGYLIDRDIIQIENRNLFYEKKAYDNSDIKGSVILKYNSDEKEKLDCDAIKAITLEGYKSFIMDVENIDEGLEMLFKKIRGPIQNISLKTSLKNYQDCIKFTETVDQFIFKINIENLKNENGLLSEIYMAVSQKMPKQPVFILENCEADYDSILSNVELPSNEKLYILQDNVLSNGRVKEQNLESIYNDNNLTLVYEDMSIIPFSKIAFERAKNYLCERGNIYSLGDIVEERDAKI